MFRRVMKRLHRKRLIRKGLFSLDRKQEIDDMVAMLKEPIFREVMLVSKRRQIQDNQTRGELIKLIENYIRHPELVSSEYDLLMRAKVEGGLLECVLKLLARDQFDPVGCIILAQQERELQVDKVSPMSKVDLE